MRRCSIPVFCVVLLMGLGASTALAQPHDALDPAGDLPYSQVTVGIGALQVGMSAQAVESLLGSPQVRTRDEEQSRWEQAGYQVSSQLPFILGFEEVWLYDPASNRSTIPVWKVYMEAGRVVVINVSGFVYPHAQEQRSFGLGPGLGAGATQAEVTSELGPPEHVQEDHTGNIELTYLARGVRFVLVEQSGESEPGVTNITLFGPLWGSEADRVRSTLSTAR